MQISGWLHMLALALGLTKSKASHIERAERAAQVAEAIEQQQQQPPK